MNYQLIVALQKILLVKKYKNKELEDYENKYDKHKNKVPTDGDATHQFKNDKKYISEDMTGVIDTQKPEKEKITKSKSCHEIQTDCDKIEDTNKNKKSLIEVKLTSNNITTIRKSPVNDTKLAELADAAYYMKQYQLIPLHNSPENNDLGDEHDGKEFMELSEYMKKICTEPSKFHETIESLNEPGKTYIWLPPTSEAKYGVNNTVSRNKLNCLLKGNNTTFNLLKYMVNNVTDVSLLDSACCPNFTSNMRK